MIGSVYSELTEDNISATHPRRGSLSYDSVSNSYSGTIGQPEKGSSWNLKILVHDIDGMVIGESDHKITPNGGLINVPAFLPINKIVFLYDDSASTWEFLDIAVLKANRGYTLTSRHYIRAIDSNGTVFRTLQANGIAQVSGKGGIYASTTLNNGDFLVGGALDSTRCRHVHCTHKPGAFRNMVKSIPIHILHRVADLFSATY